ncbi:hypothetical protein VTN77DRAFT_8231 [Rasamsonia byssochlamydoides]|uniref:uncharacterized protein n=1 Tax=Rasamsonia byssochlamydoides TaxID=89139 RepID=UPI00374392DD
MRLSTTSTAGSWGGSIGDWDRLLARIHAHLKPGGWVELQEYECSVWSDDGTHQRVEAFQDWAQKVNDASVQFGKSVNAAERLPQKLRDAGFVDVTDDVYKCPIGSWPKDPRLKQIGRIYLCSVLEAVEPYTLALFTRTLGFTYEEAPKRSL